MLGREEEEREGGRKGGREDRMEDKQIHIVINTLWYYGVKVLKYRYVYV